MQLREVIGETSEYDKKQILEVKKPKSWLKSVSAFANSFGGKLIFGIADDEEIVGLEDARKDAEIISEIIKTRMNPIPKIKLEFQVIDEKEILVVEVMIGDETPYYYSGEGQLIAFVRIGNESVPANPMQLRELVIRGSGQSYDSLPSQYKFEDMAFTKLRSVYKQRTGKSFENTDYESFGIIDGNGKLTNAGALLADESPIRHSRVFCTRWNGLTKASGLMDALDDEEYSGGLVSLFQDGLKFIMRNNRKAWRKAATRRIEYPDYPERAITEGIVNALIHRDYLIIGSEVHIDMFDDRLEIYSPGGMVDGSSLEGKDLRNISSKRRNPVLADIFSRLKLMERRGSGFKKILEDYDFQENSREDLMPKFVADNKDFLLTLYNLNYYEGNNVVENSDKVRRSSEKFGEKSLNDTQKEILTLIKVDGTNSAISIAKKLNITSRAVEKNIKVLREQGILIRHGAARGGYWEIKE
ncbi:helix-turn-helix domain-containing protein [Anaerovibrio sp. RM50]|uniref:AlbA family DNA-binding domain-containing protein n=1 Tax=Anaerovibrio sp. RM50 TaxID=1200557 RepID=UPI0004830E99|nr:helix-turn-helix domain-containing protein [Anaerovibrio sp. RM50]